MGLLILLFIVTPILELMLLVRIGRVVGFAPTLAYVLAMVVFGTVIAKNQGRRVLRDFQAAVSQGRVPERSVVSGMLAILGATALVVPGPVTDLIGLLLLLPVTRGVVEQWLGTYLSKRASTVRVYGGRPRAPHTDVGRGSFRPGEVIDTQGEEVDD